MPILPTLDANGLTVLRTEDVRANLVEKIQGSSEFGADAQTGADKLLGQLLDAPADELGQVYELIQSVYDSQDRDTAEGVQLDNVNGLVGVPREPTTYSTAPVTLTGTPATVIDTTKRFTVADSGHDWKVTADVTIGGGGTGTGTARCEDPGPIEASTGALDTIVDTVPGWTAVTNTADATAGDPVEIDTVYRARTETSLSAGGVSTDHALRTALVALPDVTAALVVSNRNDAPVDGLGTPIHNFLTIIWPDSGLDEERIAETIWNHTPTGIRSHGDDVTADVVDSSGVYQQARWTYATETNIWWEVDVTTDSDYPADGDDLVEAAILAYGATRQVGDDVEPVHAGRLITDPTVNAYYVPGVTHLVIRVGTAASPTGTIPVEIPGNEISAHDAARITVAS